MKALNITHDNIDLCKAAKAELIENIDKLVEMTKRYPLECVWGEFRRVFSNKTDIQNLIDELDKEIVEYERSTI